MYDRSLATSHHYCGKNWSAIPVDNILDQFAFKPSGSTTAALVYFTHQLTKMLEQNDYVRCLMIVDFTKAFDTVDHVILLHKLSQLSLPGFVINWICSFLSGRGQQCKSMNGASVCERVFVSKEDISST